MSESGPELAVPWNRVEVVNAATPDVPVLESVLTLPATFGLLAQLKTLPEGAVVGSTKRCITSCFACQESFDSSILTARPLTTP